MVVVGEADGASRQGVSEKCAILAARILEHRSGPGEKYPGVPSRNPRQVQPDRRIRIATDDALARWQTDVARRPSPASREPGR